MTEREQFEFDELKAKIYAERGLSCEICGLHVNFYARPQLAHIVPQTERNMRLYSKKVIHHPLNLKSVCSNHCNKKAELPRHMWEAHIKKIREVIDETQRDN